MSSTPKHIYLYEAFGWKPPVFMHMPLLLGKDGKKLSKRKNPTSIFYFRDSGYLPEALVNFLTLMGYSMPGDQEFYTLDEIVKSFDPKRIGISGAFFDIQKLNWLNQKKIIETIPEDRLWDRLQGWQFNEGFMRKLMPLIHTRVKTFGDFMQLCDFFFINDLHLTPEKLCPKNTSAELVSALLQVMIWELDNLEDWSGIGLEKAAHQAAEVFDVNYKKVMMQILFPTIMGKHQGPPLFDSVTLLGKDRTRVRLMSAIETLGGISNKRLDELKKGWTKKNCREFAPKQATS